MMKRAAFLLTVLIALAPTAAAQGTNVNVAGTSCSGGVNKVSTAAQDQKTLEARTIHNTKLCQSKGLAKTCTQLQLDAVPNCTGGACGTIYATSVTGARTFALDKMFACYFDTIGNMVTSVNAQDIGAQAAANGDQTASNTECANAMGGATCSGGNGCTRYQIACCALSNGVANDCK